MAPAPTPASPASAAVDPTALPVDTAVPHPNGTTHTDGARGHDGLDAELPTVLQDLVPLSYLVDRVVAAAYADLANLVETLPSQQDQMRKRAIVDYVLHTRRQLVKLVVLARWSTEADRIQKAMNIVGFLSSQNHAVDSSIAALSDTTTMLSGARVRNYDLATALAVLTTGTYPALPAAFADRFTSGAAPLGDDAVIATLRDVDAVLRWRLVMRREPVPPQMARVPWRIGDGRVVFTVPGLWEGTFTYGGGMEDEDEGREGAEWFLLGVMFLFRVKDARGSWSSTPTGPLKEHLVDLCNRELLRRPYFPPPDPVDGAGALPPPAPDAAEESKPDEAESDEVRAARRTEEREEVVRKRRRDRPLDRAYTFLQRLALSYQLEAVHSSAARLAATSWNGSLKVDVSAERDEVRVEYWTHKPDPPPVPVPRLPTAATARAGPGGTLVFSLRPPSSEALAAADDRPRRSRTSAREQALQAALAAAASSSTSDSTTDDPATATAPAPDAPSPPAPPAVPPALTITWLPPASTAASSTSTPAAPPSRLASLPLELSEDLDVEALLRRVTALHARETIGRLARVVREVERGARVVYPPREELGDGEDADGESGEDEEDGDSEEEEEVRVPHLRIPLLASQALEAHIHPRTGRFELRAADAAAGGEEDGGGGGARAQRLRVATERVDRERFAPPAGAAEDAWMRGVGEVVARIRASTILDDLDTLLSLLALPLSGPSTRRLPLPARELAKLGPNPALQQGRSALLFVPVALDAHAPSPAGESWVLAFVLFEEGLRAALLRARETSDGMNAFLELVEVGWLGHAADQEGKGKGREAPGRGANLGYEVNGETVQALWGQCVHRVALFQVEQQLASRRIPYRLSVSLPTTAGDLLVAAPPRPFLLLPGAALVRLPGAEKFVGKEAALQCVVDADGRIRTTLHSSFRSPIPAAARPDPAELPPNVLWNPKRGVLVFAVEDGLETAVERLLRAYATVVRAVLAAQAAVAVPSASPSKKVKVTPLVQPSGKGLLNGVGV